MAWQDILGAIGGGVQSGWNAYQWMEEQELQKEKLTQAEELKRLQFETQKQIQELRNSLGLSVADTRANTSLGVATIGADSRERVADTRATSALDVQGLRNTGSLDVQNLRNTGAASVQQLRNDGTFAVEGVRSGDRQRGQDLNFSLGQQRNATTQRGQDVGAATASMREDAENYRFGENFKLQDTISQRPARSPFGFPAAPAATPDATDPTATPPAKAGLPLTLGKPPSTQVDPRGGKPEDAPPVDASGKAEQVQQLEEQLASLLTQVRTAKPALQVALKKDIARLVQQIRQITGQ